MLGYIPPPPTLKDPIIEVSGWSLYGCKPQTLTPNPEPDVWAALPAARNAFEATPLESSPEERDGERDGAGASELTIWPLEKKYRNTGATSRNNIRMKESRTKKKDRERSKQRERERAWYWDSRLRLVPPLRTLNPKP